MRISVDGVGPIGVGVEVDVGVGVGGGKQLVLPTTPALALWAAVVMLAPAEFAMSTLVSLSSVVPPQEVPSRIVANVPVPVTPGAPKDKQAKFTVPGVWLVGPTQMTLPPVLPRKEPLVASTKVSSAGSKSRVKS